MKNENEGPKLSACEERFRPYSVEGALLGFAVTSEILMHGEYKGLPPEIEATVLMLHSRHCKQDRCPGPKGAALGVVSGIAVTTAASTKRGDTPQQIWSTLNTIRQRMYDRYQECLLALACGLPEPSLPCDLQEIKESANTVSAWWQKSQEALRKSANLN